MDLSLLLPELTVVAVVVLLAFIEIFFSEGMRRFGFGLNLGAIFLVSLSLIATAGRSGTAFQGAFATDSFAVFFKFLFLLSALAVLGMKREGASQETRPEFYLILWSCLLGMFFLVSSKDFLLFFIALELLTLSLYILTAYQPPSRFSIEAGLKYLILGSLASAFFLYGVSLIYAALGTFSFEAMQKVLKSGEDSWFLRTGILFVLSALGFKIAAVPFQIWVPDVYQGAPSPVAAFLSVASKSAGFAGLLRVLFEALLGWDPKRRILFCFLATLTLLYGNLGALVQKDMKRLLGFSSIGHAGFLLIAVALDREYVGRSLLYYLIAYGLTNLAAFYVISLVEKKDGRTSLEDYRGLARRAPFLAAALFLAVLSLAGVPPLSGFFAKFFILWSAARSELFWIVLVGVINVVISLYYYLNVVRTLYFEKARDESAIAVSLFSRILLFGLVIGMVAAGIWQSPFFWIVASASQGIF